MSPFYKRAINALYKPFRYVLPVLFTWHVQSPTLKRLCVKTCFSAPPSCESDPADMPGSTRRAAFNVYSCHRPPLGNSDEEGWGVGRWIALALINNCQYNSTQLNEHVRTQVLTPQCPHLFNTTTYETTHLLLHVLWRNGPAFRPKQIIAGSYWNSGRGKLYSSDMLLLNVVRSRYSRAVIHDIHCMTDTQVCVQPRPSTVNVTLAHLLLSAVLQAPLLLSTGACSWYTTLRQ